MERAGNTMVSTHYAQPCILNGFQKKAVSVCLSQSRHDVSQVELLSNYACTELAWHPMSAFPALGVSHVRVCDAEAADVTMVKITPEIVGILASRLTL